MSAEVYWVVTVTLPSETVSIDGVNGERQLTRMVRRKFQFYGPDAEVRATACEEAAKAYGLQARTDAVMRVRPAELEAVSA